MKSCIISYNYNYSLIVNRYYNPRISQFYATDPLAEKYPGMSPYVYTADNPVMLVDPDGREIIGKDRKPINYAIKNGKIIWSKNVTTDIKKIGEAMLSTNYGKKQFDKWFVDYMNLNAKDDDGNWIGIGKKDFGVSHKPVLQARKIIKKR